MVDLSIIIPCFNEEGNLVELKTRIESTFKNQPFKFELIFINDGSRDNTLKILNKFKSRNKYVKVINHKFNQGLSKAWLSGLNNSIGEYSCFIDADLQNHPEDILCLLKEIIFFRCDLVQGYRSSIGRLKGNRFFSSKGLNIILNYIFGMNLKDNKSGFIISRTPVLKDILSTRFSYKYLHTFITVLAINKGYQIREVETIFSERKVGSSYISPLPLFLIFSVLFEIFKMVIELKVRPKKENLLHNFIKSKSLSEQYSDLGFFRKFYLKFYAITLPLHGWIIGRNIYNYYLDLRKSQWLSRSDMINFQTIKLQKIIDHAYYKCPYYRNLFDQNNIKPKDILSYKDFNKIPLLDKAIIKKNLYSGMLAINYKPSEISRITTSGSTGEPFEFYVDKYQLEMRWASTLRSQNWTGYEFGDKCLRLWHQTIGMSLIQVIKEKIDAFLCRRKFIPVFELSNSNIVNTIKSIFKYKPKLIDGYAEAFNLISQFIINKKSNSHIGIISSAQTLTKETRLKIEKAFNSRIFDKYGSREFSGIAYQDGFDEYLVMSESYIVEILKNGKPARIGEIGEVVITDLNNKVMPFIRYRVGDLALNLGFESKSKSKKGLQIIGSIQGRTQSIILSPSGRYIPGTFFSHFFKDFQHLVAQYQIIQNNLSSIDLHVLKGSRYQKKEFDEMLKNLIQFIDKKIKIRVFFLKKPIQLSRTGKRQTVINNMKIDFQKITKNKLNND